MGQLKELKIDGNTIVVLVSDHGPSSARGNKREVANFNRPLREGSRRRDQAKAKKDKGGKPTDKVSREQRRAERGETSG